MCPCCQKNELTLDDGLICTSCRKRVRRSVHARCDCDLGTFLFPHATADDWELAGRVHAIFALVYLVLGSA